MRIVYLIDPIDSLNPKKDTTIALMQQSLKRGDHVFWALPQTMNWRQGRWSVTAQRLQDLSPITCETEQTLHAPDVDAVWMRKDPPVDRHYLHSCQLLALAQSQGVRVWNNPETLITWNEKLAACQLTEHLPDTIISQSIDTLLEAAKQWQDIIIKPLDGMGGQGVMHFHAQDSNLKVALELLTQHQQSAIMMQRYLPDISQGDKRILLIHGQAVPMALARIPASGDHRGNLAAGGQAKAQPLTAHDQDIAKAVARQLPPGNPLVGIDVIGRCLTEINLTSPTCLVELSQATQTNLAEHVHRHPEMNP